MQVKNDPRSKFQFKQLERRSLLLSSCLNWNLLRGSFFTCIYNRSSNMKYFISTLHHFTPHGRYELNKLTLLPMCGFIAQLVEHRTGIAEVMGSNPVEALIFFRLLLSSCLNWNLLRGSFFTCKLKFPSQMTTCACKRCSELHVHVLVRPVFT